MTLDDVLLLFSSILPAGMKNRIRALQGAPARLPESSHTESQKDASVQTDFDQVNSIPLQAALKGMEHEVKRLRMKEQRTAQHAQSIQTELGTANRRLEKAEEDRNAFNQWAQQTRTRLSEAELHAKHLEDTIAHLSRELHQSQSELEKTAALLDTRSAELRDAQAYLNKLDDVADTEVLQLVDGINSWIFQVSANIADAFQPRYGEQKDIQVSETAAARLQGRLGDDVLLALNSIHHADDPLVVQIVLQAAVVSYAGWLCATWDFHVGDPPCSLRRIYQSIRRTEQQSIAGRWRALSRTYVKMFLRDDADRQRIAIDVLLDHVTDILLAAGVGTPRHDLRKEVEGSYADALREVVHQSLKFQHITGERIISRDVFIATVAPGDSFDPSRMVDEWADPKRARHHVDLHPVLCTTQLGLVREERKAAEIADGEDGVTTVVLLKPTVVLTSLLEELWNEQVRIPCKTKVWKG